MKDREFYKLFNGDEVWTRNLIISVLNLLNEKVIIEHIFTEEQREKVKIPFYYSLTGDAAFLKQYYTSNDYCEIDVKVDGNNDIVPRGIITLSGISINESALTNRFVPAIIKKNIKGEWLDFKTNLNALPMNFSMNVEIIFNTLTDCYKLFEKVIEVFYKAQVIHFTWKGTNCRGQIGFPSDMTVERAFEFSYPDDAHTGKLTFTLEGNTYFPVFDPTVEKFAGNVIKQFDSNYYTTSKRDGIIEPPFILESPGVNETYYMEDILPLKWKKLNDNDTIHIEYTFLNDLNEPTEWHTLYRGNDNEYYDWKIPYFNENGEEINENVLDWTISVYYENNNIRTIADLFDLRPIVRNGKIQTFKILNMGYGYRPGDFIIVANKRQEKIKYPLIVMDGMVTGVDMENSTVLVSKTPDAKELVFKTNTVELKMGLRCSLNRDPERVSYLRENTLLQIEGNITKDTNIIKVTRGIELLKSGMLISGNGIPSQSEITGVDYTKQEISISALCENDYINQTLLIISVNYGYIFIS